MRPYTSPAIFLLRWENMCSTSILLSWKSRKFLVVICCKVFSKLIWDLIMPQNGKFEIGLIYSFSNFLHPKTVYWWWIDKSKQLDLSTEGKTPHSSESLQVIIYVLDGRTRSSIHWLRMGAGRGSRSHDFILCNLMIFSTSAWETSANLSRRWSLTSTSAMLEEEENEDLNWWILLSKNF